MRRISQIGLHLKGSPPPTFFLFFEQHHDLICSRAQEVGGGEREKKKKRETLDQSHLFLTAIAPRTHMRDQHAVHYTHVSGPQKTTEWLFQGSVITSISLHINLGQRRSAQAISRLHRSGSQRKAKLTQAGQIPSGYLINTHNSLASYLCSFFFFFFVLARKATNS